MAIRTRRAPLLTLIALALVAVIAVACSSGESGSSPTQTSAGNSSTPTTAPADDPLHDTLRVAPDFTLPSANSSPVTLSELSSEQPVVLVFYRAFW